MTLTKKQRESLLITLIRCQMTALQTQTVDEPFLNEEIDIFLKNLTVTDDKSRELVELLLVTGMNYAAGSISEEEKDKIKQDAINKIAIGNNELFSLEDKSIINWGLNRLIKEIARSMKKATNKHFLKLDEHRLKKIEVIKEKL